MHLWQSVIYSLDQRWVKLPDPEALGSGTLP